MDRDKYLLKEIDLGELGIIHCPTIEDIIKIGHENFYKLLSPFLIDKNAIVNKESSTLLDDFINELKNFDLFFFEGFESLSNDLIDVLRFFYKANVVKLKYAIAIENKKDKDNPIFITRDNFDDLCEVICDICMVEKQKEEEKREVTIQNEENRAILEEYLRLQEQAKREQQQLAEKNKVTLSEIITIVASDCNWDYDKVFNMTYFRLLHSYKCILKIDGYDIYLRYASSGQFKLEETQKHWTESIREDL